MSPHHPSEIQPGWAERLAAVARRRRVGAALRRAAPIFLVGGALSLLAVSLPLLGAGSGVATTSLLLALVGLVFPICLFAVSSRRRPTDPSDGAAILDRERSLSDTLKAALEAPRPTSDDRATGFRRLLERRADEAAETIDPVEISPIRVPLAVPSGAVLLLGAVALTLGWDAPPPRPAAGATLAERGAAAGQTVETAPPVGEDAEDASGDELPESPTPELLARIDLQQLEAGTRFEGEELETMSGEELAQLLERMREADGLSAEDVAQALAQGEPAAPAGEDPVDRGDQPAADGLEELRRSSEDPFAPPEGTPQEGGGEADASAAAGEQGESDQVQRIEMPPMANPGARPQQGGEPSAAVAVAGAEATQGQPPPEDGAQAGAGGGDSTGPQATRDDPLGDATQLAVTLELALLEAQEQEERPIERSVRHRASEAQEATVTRSGRRDVDRSAQDRRAPTALLSPAASERIRRYFDPSVWPDREPPR